MLLLELLFVCSSVYIQLHIYIYTHTYIHIFQHVQGTALASAEQPPVAAPVGWEVWAPDGPGEVVGIIRLADHKIGDMFGYGLLWLILHFA